MRVQIVERGVEPMLSIETDSERVTAEITTMDVLRIAREVGMPVSAKEAELFLRDGARAHRMWKHMIEAGRQYIAEALETESQDIWWSEISGQAADISQEYDA
jgi:hypothetical protein